VDQQDHGVVISKRRFERLNLLSQGIVCCEEGSVSEVRGQQSRPSETGADQGNA
jgi:hypothetical protein